LEFKKKKAVFVVLPKVDSCTYPFFFVRKNTKNEITKIVTILCLMYDNRICMPFGNQNGGIYVTD